MSTVIGEAPGGCGDQPVVGREVLREGSSGVELPPYSLKSFAARPLLFGVDSCSSLGFEIWI